MNKFKHAGWIRLLVIILVLPLLTACGSLGCRLMGGTASGCYSGSGTEVALVAGTVVAVPFVFAAEGIENAKKWADGLGKPAPELVDEYKVACAAKRWPEALEYSQRFIQKGWGADKACQMEALLNLGRLEEASPLVRMLENTPFKCEALVRTNQAVLAQAVCTGAVLQKPYEPSRWAMLGHAYLLQGQTEQAYTQYRRMLNHDLDFIRAFYHGDCDRHGAQSVAGLNPLLDMFAQQGWHADASAQAKVYVHDLYCAVGAAYKLQARAASSQDPAESAVLQQQADTKAASVLSGDDLAIVRNRLQHILLAPLTEKSGPDYERALAADIKLVREWSEIEARQDQSQGLTSAPTVAGAAK